MDIFPEIKSFKANTKEKYEKIALIIALFASFASADKVVKLDIQGMMCPSMCQ